MTGVNAATTFVVRPRVLLGQVLAFLRKPGGFTQTDAGELVGVTQGQWSRLERGGHALTVEQLQVFCRGVGAEPSSALRLEELAAAFLESAGMRVGSPRDGEIELEGGTAAAAVAEVARGD